MLISEGLNEETKSWTLQILRDMMKTLNRIVFWYVLIPPAAIKCWPPWIITSIMIVIFLEF